MRRQTSEKIQKYQNYKFHKFVSPKEIKKEKKAILQVMWNKKREKSYTVWILW